ncbi:MAG TPA: acyl-CoA thioesterase domain-containing protein [Acidimicrobiales bacterium]|nr:acyl-CoA thioesterase domain-containing protein [Acidimicrobiales bacterium]
MPVLDLVALGQDGDGRYTAAHCPSSGDRLLGSGVLAASVTAAAATVGGHLTPAALQATFVRAGARTDPVVLDVSHEHDGRRAATRRVAASQAGRAIVVSSVRFHQDAPDGQGWQPARPAGVVGPDVGRAEDAAVGSLELLDDFEVVAAVESPPRPVIHPYWVRARSRLPDDPGVHAALVAFLTDIGVSGSALAPGTRMRDRLAARSLDHCLWWHRRARVDDWLLVDASSSVNAGGRGLARGEVWSADGALVASFAQEVLLGVDAGHEDK